MVCVMMSPQVLLDWRRVKSNKRAGVNRGEGNMKGLQTGHKGILCAPQNKQTFSWHTVWGLVFFPFLFQIRKLGLYCNSVSTSLHVETIQRMFDQSPLETACLLPKKQRNKQRKKKNFSLFSKYAKPTNQEVDDQTKILFWLQLWDWQTSQKDSYSMWESALAQEDTGIIAGLQTQHIFC